MPSLSQELAPIARNRVRNSSIKSPLLTPLQQCVNTVSWKCEYGVLEITSDTKVSSHELKTSDLIRLLYHTWFAKPHTHISALTVLVLLKNTNK